MVAKYVNAKITYLNDHRFFERLTRLEELQPDSILPEALDRDFQRAAHHAARICARRQSTPWSPQLAEAWAELHFYRLIQSSKANNKSYDSSIKRLQLQWKQLPRTLPSDNDEIRHGYTNALHKLKAAKQRAQVPREEYLAKKAAMYEALEKRAESQHRVYRNIQYLRNQENGAHGLSSIKVPKDKTIHEPNHMKRLRDTQEYWETITVPQEIENLILARNQHHLDKLREPHLLGNLYKQP